MAIECFRVRLSSAAKDDLRSIGKRYGKKTYQVIRDLICGLESEPEKKGQSLVGRLRGLHSLHYSRFRIIYRIERRQAVVLVIGAGYHESDSRADIYKLIERALERGTLVIQDGPSSDASSPGDND